MPKQYGRRRTDVYPINTDTNYILGFDIFVNNDKTNIIRTLIEGVFKVNIFKKIGVLLLTCVTVLLINMKIETASNEVIILAKVLLSLITLNSARVWLAYIDLKFREVLIMERIEQLEKWLVECNDRHKNK